MRAVIFILLIMLIVNGSEFATAEEFSKKTVYSLPEILAIARKKNQSVAIFQSNIEAARGELTSATAYPNPDLEIELGKEKALEQPGSEYERKKSFGFGQSLEWPGKRLYRRKAAEAEVGVAQMENEDFQLELTARVKEDFFNLLLAERIRQVTAKNLETAQALVNSTQLRVESGEAPELELIKARVEFLKVTKDSRRAESRVVVAKAALNSRLGGTLGADDEVTGESSSPEKSYDLATLLDRALPRHPLILKRQKALEATGYVLSRERQSRMPDLTVTGSMSEEIDRRSYAIGLSVPFPLFYQRQGEIANARAKQTRAQAEMEQTWAELTRLVTEEYQNYRIAADQIKVFEEGLLKQADEVLRIAQLSYQQGESDLLNLLDAQRVQRATLIEYHEAQFELQAALARLEQVTGGLP